MPGKFEGGRPDGFRFDLQLFGEEVTIPVGESATVDGVTYTNTSTDGQTITVSSSGEAALEPGASVQIDGVTYTNTSDDSITVASDGFVEPETASFSVAIPKDKAAYSCTSMDDDTLLTFANGRDDITTLAAGKVATFTRIMVQGVDYEPCGNISQVDYANGLTNVQENGKCDVTVADGKTFMYDGKTYTAQGGEVKFTVQDNTVYFNEDGSTGSVGLGKGASFTLNGVTYTNTSDNKTITVPSSGMVTLEPGASVQIGGVTYTNTSDNKTITVPSDRTVTLEKGASVQIGGVTYKNTSTAAANNTITVGVDASGNGVVSRIANSATCAVSVPQGKSIVFGANKFTAVDGPATFTADSSYAPTLTSDSAVRIDTPYALKAKGVEVTNSSDANPPKSVTVDAKGAYAKITTADGGACTVSFPAAGTTAEIAGSLYTSKEPATLVKTGDTMKLTAGAVTIGAATLQTGNNNAAITNRNDKKITVGSGSVITDVEDGAEFDVTISNTSSTIEGKTYQTTGNGSAKFTVTKSGGALNVALTSGELVLDPDASCTVNLPKGMSFQIGDATYTNESEEAATFTVADGKISVDGGSSVAVAGVEVDAAVTIANTSEPGSKIYLDAKNPGSIKSAAADAKFTVSIEDKVPSVTILGKVYKPLLGTVVLEYNGTANPPTMTGGTVALGEGAAVTVNGVAITSKADETTVTSGGDVALKPGACFAVGGTVYTVGAEKEGKADVLVSGDKIGVYNDAELAAAHVEPNNGAVLIGGSPSSVDLAYASGKNFYALVNTDGELTAVAAATEAAAKKVKGAVGYFKFTAEGSKQTVTFHDMSDKQAKALGAVNIDVKGLQGEKGQPLSGLDVTDLSEGDVNLKNVPTTAAAVIGATATSYAPSFTLADEQTITLGSEAGTVYYALTAGNPGERNVASCTIEEITDADAKTAAELAKVNYFEVVTASNGAVTVSYQKATNGTAITLEKSAELHVDASGAAAGAKITVNDGVTNLVDAGANGGVTAAVGSDKNTTIGSLTYKTGFAWAPGTYILDAGTAELAVAAPENPVNTYNNAYQKVAVTKNGDVYKAVITGCDANGKTCLPAIETINLPDAVTKFDATGAGVVGKTIECANADTTVTLGAKDTTTVRSAEGGKLHIVQGKTTSTFTADSGRIAVQGVKAYDGVFKLKEPEGGNGAALTAVKGDVTAVTINDAAPTEEAMAAVKVVNGEITSVTGLSDGETFKLTVREGGKDVVYSYTFDLAATAIKKSGPSGTFYAVLPTQLVSTEDFDILAAGNDWRAPDMADAAFAWKQGTYYFSVNGEGNSAVKTIKAGTKGVEVQRGKSYIKAKVEADGTLALASVTGVAGHQATGADNGEGKTVTVDAAGTKLLYKKEGEFAVDFTNVAADSDFSNLGANDALTTAKLAKGGKVTVDGNVYEAAANNAVLSFAGSALTSGTVTVGNGSLRLADGFAVRMDAEDTSAVLTATNGAITSVTGLDKGEMLVVTKDDVKTTYTAYTDTIIWKTEGGATTVAQLAKKGNDVMAAVYKKPVATTTNFNLYNENQWPCNFLVEDNNVEIENGEVTIDFRNAGSTFVRTTIADDRTLTLKQGVVGWDGSLPEDGKLTALSGAYDITIDALATTVNFTRPAATKTANYTGKISIIGVGENSNLTVGANDSVRTVCLGKGDFVTVNGVKYEKAIAGDGEFSFLGDGLKEGTVRVTEKAALADGSTVAVAGGDGVVMTAATDEYGTRITSLKGIGEGETVTITSADKKTVTTYAYKSAGYVTKTVKINNTVASTTDLKLPENADGNIFAEGIVETTTLRKAFAWTDATTAGVKFYRTFTKNSNGNIEAMIGELTGNGNEVIEVKKGDVVVEATAKKSGTTDVLTLAVKQYDGAALVNVEDRLGYTIIVSGTNTTALHCDAGSVQEKIQARNVQGGSVFTNLAAGSYVATQKVAAGSTVSVNGRTFRAAVEKTIYIDATETAAGAKSAALKKGTVVVTGTIALIDGTTLTFSGKNKDGVVVTYKDSEITSLTDLEAGETVAVADASGKTTEYYLNGTQYMKLVTYPHEGVRNTVEIDPKADDVYDLVDGDPRQVKTEVTPAFAWPDGVTSTEAICYVQPVKGVVAIDPNAKQSWAAVDGKTFVKATVAKANENAPATVTLEKVTGTGAAALDAGVFAAGENVSVKGLKKGDKVIVGGSTYFAGADSDMALAFREGGTPAVTEGALELVTDQDAFTTTGTVKNGNTVSEIVSVATYKKNNISEDAAGVVVTVKDGEVTGLSGLDFVGSVGEEVQVVRKVDGVVSGTMIYKATGVSDEEGKKGWTVITRSESDNEEGSTTWQRVVADSAENILEGGEDRWQLTNLVTERNFDGNGVGYFKVDAASGGAEIVKPQTDGGTISKDNAGEVYLKVTSEYRDNAAYITGLGFVKVQENGALVETTAPENFQGVTIDAALLDVDGVALPAHTVKVAIINVDSVKGFAGLNAADTVSGDVACTVSLGKADKNGNFTATSTFFVHEGPYTINGAGELVEGTFAVTGKATAAAKETVEYKHDEHDSVVLVTVEDGSVAGVKHLDVGGTVTVTGSTKGDKDVYTAALDKDDNTKTVITRTTTRSGMTVKYTKTAVTDNLYETDVIAMNGYTSSPFDFGATADGSVGIFEVGHNENDNEQATIAAQTAGVTFDDTANEKYLAVAATKDKTGMVTINRMNVVSFTAGEFRNADFAPGTIFIEAPEGAGLTLSKDADASRRPAPGSPDVIMAFQIKNAQAGKSYLGFSGEDGVFATLEKDQTITVGASAKTAKTVKAKADGEVTVLGDGKVYKGTFEIGAGLTAGLSDYFSSKISGPAAAVAVIENGMVVGLSGLKAGQKVTVTSTDYLGAVFTEEYAAAKKANADGTLTITRTKTADGVTTVATADVETGGEIAADTVAYTATGESVNSTFDWVKMNSGYFKTELAAGNMTKFGDVKVEPAATKITKDNAGEIYLKAEAGRQLRLQRVKTDGTMEDVPWADDMTGTLTLVGMMGDFDRDTVIHKDTEADPPIPANVPLPAGIKVAVVDAATYYDQRSGEVATAHLNCLKEGDVVTTTKLAAGEKIRVNGVYYTMGAADLLRVEIGADGKPVLVDGTVRISNYQTIETTKGSFTIGVGYTVVKVLNGEVVAASGGVFVTDGQGNQATYTKTGVNYTEIKNGAIRTAALTKGQTIKIDGKTYTAGADGAVTFNKTNSGVTLVDGVLLLEADTTDDTSLALKDATVTFDEAVLWNDSHVLVAVRNGVVASITGLKKGDRIKVGDTTYKAETDTVVKVWTGDNESEAVTTYLSAAGGDVLRAADNTTDISKPGNAIEGQFSCDVINGRSIGYFDVTVKKDSKGNVVFKTATIADQTAKTHVKAAKGTEQIYAVASLANGVLSIGAIQAANDGTKTVIKSADKATLLDENTRLSVTAPRVIKYCKEDGDKFRIALNNVACDSIISGLDAGDTVKTEVLDAGLWVRIGDDSILTNTITYRAGAKGALTFQGEGTNKTTLLNGVIKLSNTNPTAILSGSAGDRDDDVTVTATGTVTVAVRNGVVTSITGLTTLGANVTLRVAGDTTGEKTVVYEVMRSLQDAKTGLWTVMVKRTEGGHVSYGTFTEKQNFYATSSTNAKGVYSVTNGYKAQGADTVTNTANLWTADGTKTAYVAHLLAQTPNETIDASNDDPYTGNRGETYVVATVTTANGVSTIKSLQKAIINAQGVPEIVKGATASGVKIDGTIDADAHEYAKLNFAIPKATAVTITNAALGSVFTGVKAGDSITSAAADGYALAKGSVTVYHGKESRTVTYTPGTKDATAATISTNENGAITSLTGLDTAGEKVAIVGQTSGGRITTTYAVANVTVGSGKTAVTKKQLTKTVEDANGQKKVFSVILDDLSYEQKTEAGFTDAASYDWLKDTKLLTENTASCAAVSEFDWTTAKKLTGYFEVATAKNGTTSATVAAQTKAVAISPYADAKQTKANEKSYIAVSISADGVVSGVRQVRFDRSNTLASYGAGEGETKFSGTVNIAAPTAALLYFDRNDVDADTVDGTATVNITGVMGSIYSGVPGVNDHEDFSIIENLKEGDTVTTAKLAVANAKTGAPAQKVRIGVAGDAEISTFTAGAAGALSFRVQEGNVLALTGGTIELPSFSGPGEYSRDYIHIGTRLLKLTHGNLTVTATNGGKAYTVGDLKEGETFTVEDFATGTVREYKRSATTLFCTTKGDTTTTAVYNIGTGASLTGAVLEGRSGWTVYTDTNKTFKEDNTLVSGKAVTVDLTKAETRVAADGKAWIAAGNIAGDFLNTAYDLVIDKYMVDPKKATGSASVIGQDNLSEDVEAVIGTARAGWYDESSKKYRESSYVAASGVAQTIKAADSWMVLGSDKDDVIYGAAEGEDILRGGAGDDTLIGGGADDIFRFGLHDTGHDVVKSYVTGKDRIEFRQDGAYNGFDIEDVELVPTQVGKSFTADVLLHDGTYDEETGDYTNGVLLSGMGNGKAVTISDKTYYFGSAASTKGMTFSYVEGAYYVANGNTTTANTLTVGTDNTKATAKALGDKVEVDLSDTTHYRNIDTADASKSGNDVILTADGDGSTLKGGTYKSTLKAGAGQDSLVGGSGEDVFWFDTVEKNDTVTGYTSGKDSLYLGDFDKEKDTAVNVNGLEVTVSGSDVVFSNGDLGSVTLKNGVNAAKPVTIRADVEGKETMDYYVGKAGTYDKNGKLTAKAANAFTATVGKDAGYVDPDAATKEIALTSYYVGNDTANDTLKLVGTDKTSKLTAKVSLQDMAKHASSIDTLDVSGLTAVAGSEVTVEGKREGTFTLIGSASNTVKESFDLSNLAAGDNKVAVTNFSVDDVIELAAGMTLEKANGANAVYTMRMDGKDYGTLTITGAKAANINYNESANRVEYKK